jgi:hypothetical protein
MFMGQSVCISLHSALIESVYNPSKWAVLFKLLKYVKQGKRLSHSRWPTCLSHRFSRIGHSTSGSKYAGLCVLLFGSYTTAPLLIAWLSGNTPVQ